jgi:hypothetical protein
MQRSGYQMIWYLGMDKSPAGADLQLWVSPGNQNVEAPTSNY